MTLKYDLFDLEDNLSSCWKWHYRNRRSHERMHCHNM